jgi:hypothetical protein
MKKTGVLGGLNPEDRDRYTDTVSRCPSPQGVGRALIHSSPAFPIKHPHGFNVSSARPTCPQRLHLLEAFCAACCGKRTI